MPAWRSCSVGENDHGSTIHPELERLRTVGLFSLFKTHPVVCLGFPHELS